MNKTAYVIHEERMAAEAEIVKHLLDFCSVHSGAKITISVEHDNGHKAVLRAYDHAALVQGLYDTLDYFQSEL